MAISIPERNQLVSRASTASVIVASLLLLAKGSAWWLTDSVSLFASLMDSILDMGASLINMFAVRKAMIPPDADHRFGHGKAEALSALLQAFLISGSAIWLGYEVIDRIRHPQPTAETLFGVGVMVLAIVVTLVLVRYQNMVVAKTESTAIKADSAHYQTDLYINGGVITSLFLVEMTGLTWIDPLFGGGIALYILYTAWEILQDSFKILMDEEVGPETRKKIEEIAKAHPEVKGVHDVRTRSSGIRKHIQLHLEMDGKMTLFLAHEVAEAVEKELQKAFPNSDILIHQDPEGIEEDRDDF